MVTEKHENRMEAEAEDCIELCEDVEASFTTRNGPITKTNWFR